MFNTIRGKLIETGTNYICVETQGLGFEVNVTDRDIVTASNQTNEVILYLFAHQKESNPTVWYGFFDRVMRGIFIELISVSGVGPKIGLSILNTYTINQLKDMFHCDDVGRLSQINGLGKKTSQKLIIELKDRSKKWYVTSDVVDTPTNDSYRDAYGALISLGLSSHIIEKKLSEIYKRDDIDALSIEEIIKLSL
jgi:holliday junction DNA helicase RuvA